MTIPAFSFHPSLTNATDKKCIMIYDGKGGGKTQAALQFEGKKCAISMDKKTDRIIRKIIKYGGKSK